MQYNTFETFLRCIIVSCVVERRILCQGLTMSRSGVEFPAMPESDNYALPEFPFHWNIPVYLGFVFERRSFAFISDSRIGCHCGPVGITSSFFSFVYSICSPFHVSFLP